MIKDPARNRLLRSDSDPDYKKWVIINLMPFWVYLRIKRPYKEVAKTILFTLFPFVFSRRIEFFHWKSSRHFISPDYALWRPSFWKKIWTNQDNISLPNLAPHTEYMYLQGKLAIIIHAFYPDILQEIVHMIHLNRPQNTKLFVTCTVETEEEILSILSKQPIPFSMQVLQNKGRDVLPFLHTIKKVREEGFEMVLKLHTKKSSHLVNNTNWKEDIFQKLLRPGKISESVSLMASHPDIGIIGPEGHILPMAMYYSNNADKVKLLCNKMALDIKKITQVYFVAGTMFYAKLDALQPLMSLDLTALDFEEEEGQVDGTMAHAIERALGASCLQAGLLLVDTKSTVKKLHAEAVLHYKYSI